MATYEVTTFDVCTEGMERLRNNDEFILAGYVTPATTREDLESQFKDDMQAYVQPDGFDYDACRTAVHGYMMHVDMERATLCVDEEGCNAYLYLRTTS